MTAPLLRVTDLAKRFPLKGTLFGKGGVVHAVDGVSFDVRAGETLGIVGESGCGKSTTARLVMRLIEPDEGRIALEGREIGHPQGVALVEARRAMQMVFQDSFASLNPRLTVETSIAFAPRVHGVAEPRSARHGARPAAQGRARSGALRRPLSASSCRAASASASTSPARSRCRPSS